MSWFQIVQLLANYSPTVVNFVLERIEKREDPTPEDLQKLRELISKPGESYFV